MLGRPGNEATRHLQACSTQLVLECRVKYRG